MEQFVAKQNPCDSPQLRRVRTDMPMVRNAILVVLVACGGKGGDGDNPDGNMNGDAMSDDGPCTPDSLRCNGNVAEKCNADGTMWVPQQTCTTFCADGTCALDGLDVSSDMTLDGVVHVQGAVVVRSGATLSSPAGDLTLFADSITVESGGSISAAPTGASPLGVGFDATCFSCQAGGGYYGTSGDGSAWGSDLDSDVQPGSPSGNMDVSPPMHASGGGVLRLVATGKIDISGQITANGANGNTTTQCVVGGAGGSGGGILIMGDDVTVSGAISSAGGLGAPSASGCGVTAFGRAGGVGRVKILFGSHNDISTMPTGRLTKGLAPPIPLKSTSHPDPTLVYNDGFLSLDLGWPKPFTTLQGYYVKLDASTINPPTPANGTFVGVEKVSFSPNDVHSGDNYVHIVSVDQMSAVGTVETTFHVRINTSGPSVSSTSHPNQTQFSNNVNPFFAWSYPQGDASVSGAYFVMDHFGLTVPATTDMKLPATQKQLLQSNTPAGVWVFHVVSIDQEGRLSKAAGHYRVNIGPDPGSGGIIGRVVNAQSQPVVGAHVTINRGLYNATTDGSGNYSIPTVTAGTWELNVTMGAASTTKSITIMPNMTAPGDVTL
jgi:hypothetical protein